MIGAAQHDVAIRSPLLAVFGGSIHAVHSQLTSQQEAAVTKAKATGAGSAEQEATLKKLKRLQRQKTTISIDNTPGHSILSGNVRVQADDPAAQEAIQASLRDISKMGGSDAAASALGKLLNNPEVKAKADPSAPEKKKALAGAA